jgi:hypothetical protein
MPPANDAGLDALVLDLVEWVANEPRPYAEVMDAWRTTCPKLAVWEEAVDRGLVLREAAAGRGVLVTATAAGRRFLARRRSTALARAELPSLGAPVSGAR